MHLLLALFCTLLFCSPIESYPTRRDYIVVGYPDSKPGMFAMFTIIAGFLDYYEQGLYAGITVDFGSKGLYYDPRFGDNWWRYYCEPIQIGKIEKRPVKLCAGDECAEIARHAEEDLSRERVHELITKYISIRAFLKNKVERFISQNFSDSFIIGIHYRGTDKYTEAPRVPYEKVLEKVNEQIEKQSLTNYRIFIATDESNFLDYMKKKFPNRVLANKAIRAKNKSPVHYNNSDPYKHGQEAIIDVLLLSRCHIMIRTSSNLSLWAGYFNPQMPVISLNKRY